MSPGVGKGSWRAAPNRARGSFTIVLRVGSALLLGVSFAACGDDGGIGISLLETTDLVQNEGDAAAEVSVFVSRDCFYSVSVDGTLLGSGRWKAGRRTVRLGPSLLSPCENPVRIQVAAQDGSSGVLDTEVWWCDNAPCPAECGNIIEPDAGVDSGGVDPYPGPLCDQCNDTDECGGLPNLCVSMDGASAAICGTECYGIEDCPGAGFDCLSWYDDYGNFVTSVCLPWPPQPTCP